MNLRQVAGKILRSIPFLLYFLARLPGEQQNSEPSAAEMAGEPEKILAIRLDAIGDLLMTTPALRSLRRRYPRARIDVLVQPGAAFAARDFPFVDRTHVLRCNFLMRGEKIIKGAIEWISKCAELRRQRYDLVVDFSCLFHSAAAARATGGRVRLGFKKRISLGFFRSEGFGRWYTHEVEADESVHMSDQMLALALPLGGEADGGGWEPPRNPAFAQAAAQLLASAGVGPDEGPLIMLHPGGKWPPKRWAAEQYAKVIDLLQDKGMRVAVIGGPGENEITETIRASCRTSPLYLWPPEPMETIWGLLTMADAFLGNDSGPMHLAAAAGVPVVAIFGPTHPRRYAPRGSDFTPFYAALDCSPCPMYFSGEKCHRGHNYCMDGFTPTDIAAGIERAVENRAASGRESD